VDHCKKAGRPQKQKTKLLGEKKEKPNTKKNYGPDALSSPAIHQWKRPFLKTRRDPRRKI